MPLFEWNEEYAVGVESMDRDHRDLLRLSLALETAVNAGVPPTELLQKFDETLDAIQSRMEGEKVLLKQAAYPALRFHKREHDDLLQILIEFLANVAAGVTTISLSSIEFLGGWLGSHFRSEDRCAAQFLAQPVRVS